MQPAKIFSFAHLGGSQPGCSHEGAARRRSHQIRETPMFKLRNQAIAALALAAATFAAGAASAQSVIALVNDKTIAMISPANWKVTASWDAKGVNKLVGIDVRPADGMLYGLTADGWIVTIDTKTGATTKKAELSAKLAAGVTVTAVDFNPVADRLRIIASDGTNLRVNVDDGKAIVDGMLKFAETDMHKGEKPNVVAAAYSFSFKGTKETTLYDVDATIGGLFRQAPPNDGVLNTIGKLGIKLSGPVAFNIVNDGDGKNAAWLFSGGMLYSVDLMTGAAKPVGKLAVKGTIKDIAWWPAPQKTM
jgi:hypothetical protein